MLRNTARNRFILAHREARLLVASEMGEAGTRHVSEPERTHRYRSVMADRLVGEAALQAAWAGRALRQGHRLDTEAKSCSLLRSYLGARNDFERDGFEAHLRKFVRIALADLQAKKAA